MWPPFGRSTLLRRLDDHVKTRSHKPFVVLYRGEQFSVLTYADLAEAAETWAARFGGLGAAAGSTVFLILRPGADGYAAFLGAMRAGLIPAFLAPLSPRQEPQAFWSSQRALFARTRPAAAVVGEADATLLRTATEAVGCPLLIADHGAPAPDIAATLDPEPEVPALLQHSSGTTGLQKAVRLTFQQVDRHVGMFAAPLRFTEADVVASWLPLYHDMGLIAAFLAPLTLGASVVALDPLGWAADPASLLRAITRHRATLCWMPNFAFAHLVRTRDPASRHDLSSLRALIDCSGPCRPETIDAFCAAFADTGFTPERIACSYGMAEAVFACTQTLPGAAPRRIRVDAERLERSGEVVPTESGRTHAFLSCGPPVPGVDLRIAAPASPDGVIMAGEIEVASAVLFDGYRCDDGEPIDPPADGRRATGDVGFLLDGELYVCGRTLERLIVHGRNVFAGDVEALVSAVPGVKPGRAVALGVHDAASGGEVAWVMLEAQGPLADPADRESLKRAIRAACQDGLDLTLQGVEIGPPGWLAKSTSGKMSRAQNLEKLHRLIAHASPAEVAPPAPPAPAWVAPPAAPDGSIRAAVVQALAECFGPAAAGLPDDAGWGEAQGWDSLGHTILILRIEALTGVRAADSAAAQARTVGGLIAAFTALTEGAPVRRAA